MALTLLWIVMAILLAALLYVLRRADAWWEWVVKPAAAATFIVTGFVAGATATSFGRIMLAGLFLAALGDVLLIPKSKRSFLAGLVAFLLGHVADAVAFYVRGVDLAVVGGALAGLVVLAIPIVRWLWPNVERPMRIPVAAYVTIITAMVALAAGTAWRGGGLLFVGAFGFYLSDLCVARERFVEKGFINRAIGLPLYFGAQMMLATASGP